MPPEVRRVSAHEAVPRQALELLVGEWSELFDRGCASPDHRGPRLHELRVPGLELRRSAAPLPFLQQAVPLPERALVRAKLWVPERPERHDRVVEEPAAVRRISANDVEVLRPEEHRPHLASELALAAERRAIHLELARG